MQDKMFVDLENDSNEKLLACLSEYHAMNCLKRFFEESLKKACSYNKEDKNDNTNANTY